MLELQSVMVIESTPVPPFQLRLPGFQGPIDELLRLTSQRKLDVGSVELVEVIDQFVHYLREEELVDLQLTGEFLAGSARLMAWKSSVQIGRAHV